VLSAKICNRSTISISHFCFLVNHISSGWWGSKRTRHSFHAQTELCSTFTCSHSLKQGWGLLVKFSSLRQSAGCSNELQFECMQSDSLWSICPHHRPSAARATVSYLLEKLMPHTVHYRSHCRAGAPGQLHLSWASDQILRGERRQGNQTA
jgi:hypothetical protein